MYNEVFIYKIQGILPEKVLSKPDIKKSSKSRRTIREDSIGGFKSTCKNYGILRHRENNYTMSNLAFFSIAENKKYIIPYESEIKGIIFFFHDANSIHVPCNEILFRIKKEGIVWLGMALRIKRELDLCSCHTLLVSRSKIPRIRNYMQIFSKAPQERLQIDLAHLPKVIKVDMPSPYLLNIKDHFSKYSWSFLIQDKISKEVAKKIKLLFNEGHIPTLMQTDNGLEFKGKLDKLLRKSNVKHIKSRPYNPQCQGLVENFNKYVKRYLAFAFLTSKSIDFNVE